MTQYNFTVDHGLTLNDANITAVNTPDNPSAINFVGNSSGDGSGYTTMQLVPDETLTGSGQYLVLDPTGGGHIHIRAGGEQDNATGILYLGGENSYVQLPSGPNPNVLIAANTHVWTFGNDGDITLPNGNPVIQTPDQTGTITIEVRGDATERSEIQLGSDGGTDQYVYISSINGTGNRVSIDMGAYANTPAYAKIQTYDGVSVQNEWLFTTAALDPNEAFLYVPGGAAITTPNATGNVAGRPIFIEAGSADQSDLYTTAGGDLYLKGGRGAFNDGGGGGPGGDIWITSGESSDPAGVAGNVYITAGPLQDWTFDNTGGLNLPGGTGVIESTANNIGIYSDAAQNNGVVLYDAGVEIYGIDDVAIYADNGNLTWTFDNSGNLLAPGNISAVGNVTANNFIGNIQLVGNVQGTQSNVTLVAGSYSYTFDNTGVATFPTIGGDEGGEINFGIPAANTTLQNSVKIDVYRDRLRFFEGSANVKGAYLDLANCPSGLSTAIGYRDIPQIAFSANATAAATAAGCHYYSTTAGNLALTLPDNSSVAFPTGATLTIVVNAAGNVLVNQGTGVSLYQAGASATGNRVVGAYGLATVMKVAANTWVISGTGVY